MIGRGRETQTQRGEELQRNLKREKKRRDDIEMERESRKTADGSMVRGRMQSMIEEYEDEGCEEIQVKSVKCEVEKGNVGSG